MRPKHYLFALVMILVTAIFFCCPPLTEVTENSEIFQQMKDASERLPKQNEAFSKTAQSLETTATNASDHDVNVTPARNVPGYCLPGKDVTTMAGAPAKDFVSRHPELGITQEDFVLIYDSIAEIGIAAAEAIHEYDAKTMHVLAKGKYHDKPIEELAGPAHTGDAEAAMIYGSYLMHQGWTDKVGLDMEKLRSGERLLLQAYQNGSVGAISRVYAYYHFASKRAWRQEPGSAVWHETQTAQIAYGQWLIGNTTAGRALMIDNDFRKNQNHLDEESLMPPTEQHAPASVYARLGKLNSELPPAALPDRQVRIREHLLWLNRRGLVDSVFEAIGRDCKDL